MCHVITEMHHDWLSRVSVTLEIKHLNPGGLGKMAFSLFLAVSGLRFLCNLRILLHKLATRPASRDGAKNKPTAGPIIACHSKIHRLQKR